MAETELSFQVRVMRPPRPASSVNNQNANEEPRKLRLPLLPTDTFSQAWKKIQAKYDESYPLSEREFACFTRIQDHFGNDFTMSDRVGAHFKPHHTVEQCVLVVQQTSIDKESSLMPGTLLQPKDFKRKRVHDLTPDRQEVFKRRRMQEVRYGSAVNGLDADTPVTSRESEENEVEEEVEEQRYKDGFKIPPKPKPSNNARRRQNTQIFENTQGTVLVEDSQPQQADGRPHSAVAALQARVDARVPQSQSVPPVHSSPLQAAVARAVSVSVQRSPTNANSRHRTIPTPDSNANLLFTSDDAPTSGQRPRSSHASLAHRAKQFLPQREPQQDVTVQDPIQDDDDEYYAVSDYEDDEEAVRQPRGRARSRSVETIPRDQFVSNATDQPTSKSTPNEMSDYQPSDNAEAGPTSSNNAEAGLSSESNAYDKMRSSQTRKSSERTTSAGTKYTAEEDRDLLEGLRKGWTVARIKKHYNIDRSESSLRSRKGLLAEKADGKAPSSGGLNEGAESGAAVSSEDATPRPSQRQDWSETEFSKLRNALRDGKSSREIMDMFMTRTDGSVLHKIRDLMPKVIKFEKDKSSFPRSEIDIYKWTDEHNLKLRRWLVERVDADEAYQEWFSYFTKGEVKAKMKEYKRQMQPNRSSSPQLATREEPESSSRAPPVVNSAAAAEVQVPGTEQPPPQPTMNSSPPDASEAGKQTSPNVIITTQEQRAATTEQSASQTKGEGVAQRTATSAPARRGTAPRVQSNLGQFQFLSTRRADQPARPSQPELDAQVDCHRHQARATANSRQQESRAPFSSHSEDSEFDEGGGVEFDEACQQIVREAEVQVLLDSQLGGGVLAEVVSQPQVVSDAQVKSGPQALLESDVQQNSGSQPQLDSESRRWTSSAVIQDSQTSATEVGLDTQRTADGQHDLDSQLLGPAQTQDTGDAETEDDVPDSVKALRVRLAALVTPERGRPVMAIRPSETGARSLQQAQNQSRNEPVPERGSQPQPQQSHSRAAVRRGSATASISQQSPSGRVRTISNIRSRRPEAAIQVHDAGSDTGGTVDPWIPFEKRPVMADGTIDAGTAHCPYYVKKDHPWAQSVNDMWTQAERLAKQEWISDMYDYISLNNLQHLRIAAQDQKDLKKVGEQIHEARKKRRAKMNLPPLYTLRRPRLIVPGFSDIPHSKDDDDRFSPDLDEDDELDYTMMLKDEPLPREVNGEDLDDDENMLEDPYPNGVEYGRQFIEVEDEPDQYDKDEEILVIGPEFLARDREESAQLSPEFKRKWRERRERICRRRANAELDEFSESDSEVDVYDDTRCFIETRPSTARSNSPVVQPSQSPKSTTNHQHSDLPGNADSSARPTSRASRNNTIQSSQRPRTRQSNDAQGLQAQHPQHDVVPQSPTIAVMANVSETRSPPPPDTIEKSTKRKKDERVASPAVQIDDEQQTEAGRKCTKQPPYRFDDEEDFVEPKSKRRKKTKPRKPEGLEKKSTFDNTVAKAKVEPDQVSVPPPAPITVVSQAQENGQKAPDGNHLSVEPDAGELCVQHNGTSKGKRSMRRRSKLRQRQRSDEMGRAFGLDGTTDEIDAHNSVIQQPMKAANAPPTLTHATSATRYAADPIQVHGAMAINGPQREASATPSLESNQDASTSNNHSGNHSAVAAAQPNRGGLFRRMIGVATNWPAPPQTRRESSPPPQPPFANDDEESSESSESSASDSSDGSDEDE